MDRLSIILTLMTGAVLTGGFTIAVFSLGYYNWLAILICAALGFSLAWPTGYVASRLIKKNDPAWAHRKVKQVNATIPAKNAREV